MDKRYLFIFTLLLISFIVALPIVYNPGSDLSGSYLNRNNIYLNITTNGINSTVNLYNSTTLVNSSFTNTSIFNGLCYQETANVSTSCGGLNTGSYVFSETSNDVYINYSKPFGVQNSSLWQVKGQGLISINYTISALCFNQSVLQFDLHSDSFGSCNAWASCYNGTGWQDISNRTTGCPFSGGGSNNAPAIFDGNWNTGAWHFSIFNRWGNPRDVGSPGASFWDEEAMIWNITNGTGISNNEKNFTNLSDGNYYYNVTGCYSNNSCETSSTYNITIDTTKPLISFTSNTSSGSYNGNSIFGEISYTEVNPYQIIFNLYKSNVLNQTINLSSGVCYQEFTNQTSTCGGLNTGSYYFNNSGFGGNPNLIIDGDWSSGSSGGNMVYVYMNYSKPLGSTNNSVWEIKDDGGVVNLSISSCWSADINKLYLLEWYHPVGGLQTPTVFWGCYNGSDILTLRSQAGSGTAYEEAMNWIFSSIPTSYNFTSLTDGNYQLNVSITDLAGNTNSTDTKNITLDTTPPILTIYIPQQQTYGINNISINYSSIDALSSISSCRYSINYSNGTSVIPITFLSSCKNTTANLSDGSYILTIYSNDSLNNMASSNVTFGISTASPAIVLSNPNPNNYSNNRSVSFNYTASFSTGLSSCKLYSNISGSWSNDYTWTNPNSGIMNYTVINGISDGTYQWNVFCTANGSGATNWALNNRTFTIDTISPNHTVTITTTTGSQYVSFNTTVTDVSPTTCMYSVYNLGGTIDSGNANVSFTCGTAQTFATSSFATYNLFLVVTDSAGNVANSTTQFTTSSTSGGVITGGGGGGSVVPATSVNWAMTSSSGGKSYELKMTKGSSRSLTLQFLNKENSLRKVTLKCEQVSGPANLCDSVFLDTGVVNLPVIKDAYTISDFSVAIDKNMASGTYVANIIATDDLGNQDLITVNANVGAFGVVSDTFVKLTSNKDVGGLQIPYAVLFIFMVIIFGFVTFTFLKNKSYGAGLSFLLAFVVSFTILTFI